MNRTPMLFLIAVIALLSVGCATSGPSSGTVDSSRDLAEMKERILELQEQAAVAQVEMDRIRAQMLDLESKLAAGTAARASPPLGGAAEPGPAVQTPPPASAAGESPIEETDLEPEPAVPPVSGVEDGSKGPAGTDSMAPATNEERGQASLQPVDPAAQALYDRGYTLYHQGKYLDSEASFQRFLQAYPSTELSDNAQFWIGESRYARGDVRGALAAFREVLQKYPEANKVPDALIKEGDCLEKLGDRDGARDRYNEVRRRFPESGAAVMAEDRLASLDG